MPAYRDFGNAGLLAAANLAGMALPLVALPILAQRIGLEAFGMVALAQSVGIVSVLLVDAGFNTESMRATAASDETAPLQPLLDNLIARSRLAIPAALLTLIAGALIPGLPLAFVAISLLQLAGTLLFAQWWLIATGDTFRLLAMQIFGRVLSVTGIIAFVHAPSDSLLAATLQCSATLFSGVVFCLWLLPPRRAKLWSLDRLGYRAYLARVAPTVGSGFVVALSTQAPQLLLGVSAGTQQVGLFASGEKIARAAAFAVGAVDQSFIAPVAKRIADGNNASQRAADRVIAILFVTGAVIGLSMTVLSDTVIHVLFGKQFADATSVLWAFGLWLPSYVARRGFVNLKLAAHARLDLVSRSQYVEAVATIVLCALGAWHAGAIGATFGLLAAEACAWCALITLHMKRKQPT